MRIKPAIILLFTLFFIARVEGESFRGHIVDEIHLEAKSSYEKTVELALEEMVAVSLADRNPFLLGLEVEILLSNLLKKYFDSFGVAIYKGISPYPRLGIRTLSGSRVFFHYLPYQNRVYLTIPVDERLSNQRISSEGNFFLEEPIRPEEFPLLISITQIMKGIPNTLMEKKFFLTVRAVMEKKGLLSLAIKRPSGRGDEPIELYLDDAPFEEPDGPREIEAGIHHLRVVSSAFKEVNTSFTVESGQTSRLEIELEETASRLTIEAPKNSEVYLDGRKLLGFADSIFELKEGNHIVLIKIGDYSLSKRFLVEKGKNYHLSCVFDIIINEE